MQLSRRARVKGAKKRGFITTGADIIKRETPLALYKGLGAVVTGIVPKMAIRFTSFEAYKKLLANKETGEVSSKATFLGESFCLWGCYAVRTCILQWDTSSTQGGPIAACSHFSSSSCVACREVLLT